MEVYSVEWAKTKLVSDKSQHTTTFNMQHNTIQPDLTQLNSTKNSTLELRANIKKMKIKIKTKK